MNNAEYYNICNKTRLFDGDFQKYSFFMSIRAIDNSNVLDLPKSRCSLIFCLNTFLYNKFTNYPTHDYSQ